MTRAEEQLESIRRAEDIIRNGRKAKLPYELPQPVKRDKHNKLTADYTKRDWFAKIAEETFEAYDRNIDEELVDIITVCISYLDALGYDENDRFELFRHVNQKNRNRGYLED